MNKSRRILLKKAYVTPTLIALGTMTLTTSLKGSSSLSGGNNGWGNGDQDAPGNSGSNNNAENNQNGNSHKKHGDPTP